MLCSRNMASLLRSIVPSAFIVSRDESQLFLFLPPLKMRLPWLIPEREWGVGIRHCRFTVFPGILLIIAMTVIFAPLIVSAGENTVKVGVLANRGYEHGRTAWTPTIQYLSKKVAPHKFELLPLSFSEVMPAVRDRRVDFVVCNPSIFVEIEATYGATGIATIKNRILDGYYTVFGGVIFTRSDNRSIRTFNDLKGKSFVATDRESLGGWQSQWREFKQAGIDPYRQFSPLRFAGQHDAAVFEVMEGRADAGACRTDVLEKLAAAGKIRLTDIRVIPGGSAARTAGKSFPFLISTRLYPEWAFAKLSHTPSELAARVSLALQSMKAGDHAAVAGEYGGWSYPLNYQPVHDLHEDLKIGFYGRSTPLSLQETIMKYRNEAMIVVLAFIFLAMALLWAAALNRRSSRLRARLDNELKERNRIAAEYRESEERWNFALEGSGDGVWDWNAETGEVYFSRQWKTMLGFEEHEIGNTLDEWDRRVHPDDRDYVYREINRHFSGETPIYTSEHRILCKDGSYKWILDRGKVVSWTKEGKPLRVVGTHTDLTERRTAEDALKASKRKLDLALASARMGTWVLDLASGMRHFDDQVCRLLGINPDTFRGTAEEFFSVIHPEDRGKVKEALFVTINQGSPYEPEYRVILPDGTIRFIAARGMMTRDETGKPARMDGVGWDITERRMMEEALRESEERYRSIFENAREGIFQSTPEGGLIQVNPAMARMGGYQSPQEMMEAIKDISTQLYVNPQERERFKKTIEERGSVENFLIETYRKDGSRIWVSINARAVSDEEGRILYYEGTHEDVTEHKQMEDMIRENERRYRHLVENSNDIIYTTDARGVLTYVNPATQRLTGYPVSQLFGKHYSFLIREDYRKPLGSYYENQYRQRDQMTYYEFPIVTSDGSEKWIGQQVQLIFDQDKITGFHATARDITDRMKADEERREREKLTALIQTAGMISHEMNQPLQALLGQADLMSMGLPAGDAKRERLEIIREQVERMRTITRKLMNISRYETKPYAGKSTIVDLDKSAE